MNTGNGENEETDSLLCSRENDIFGHSILLSFDLDFFKSNDIILY